MLIHRAPTSFRYVLGNKRLWDAVPCDVAGSNVTEQEVLDCCDEDLWYSSEYYFFFTYVMFGAVCCAPCVMCCCFVGLSAVYAQQQHPGAYAKAEP